MWIYICELQPALGAGRELTASHAPACLQPGAEPDDMGVNRQVCQFERWAEVVFQGEIIRLSVPAGAGRAG